MPKASRELVEQLSGEVASATLLKTTTLVAAVDNEVVVAREEVYEIVTLAAQGMPITPSRVLTVLSEKYYRCPSTPSVVAGEAEAQYNNRKNAIDACALHVRAAVEVLAKMRSERDGSDPGADIAQIGDAYRSVIYNLSQKLTDERETADRRGYAALVSEMRETLAEASTFFGKPVGKHVKVTGKVTHEHEGTVQHNVTPSGAYSSWDGSPSDLVAVDTEFIEEE